MTATSCLQSIVTLLCLRSILRNFFIDNDGTTTSNVNTGAIRPTSNNSTTIDLQIHVSINENLALIGIQAISTGVHPIACTVTSITIVDTPSIVFTFNS